MWIYFESDDFGRGDELVQALRPWLAQDPPRAYVDDGVKVKIPLLLKTGVEQDAVVAHVVDQLAELADLMASAGMEPLRKAPAPTT